MKDMRDKNCTYLSLENTKCLRGILALLVIVTHIRGNAVFLNDTVIGSLLTVAAYPSVGMFFLLMGYGLRESFTKKVIIQKHFSDTG